MKYLVLDLETGSKEVYGRKGHFRYNPIVAIGLKWQIMPKPSSVYIHDQSHVENIIETSLLEADILVMHNAKFDLLHLWKYRAFQDWLMKGGRIYDTQQAEYLLSGQRHKYPALRDIAVNKYGCQPREKLMEPYWDKDTIKILDNVSKRILFTLPINTKAKEVMEFLENRRDEVGNCDIISGHIDTTDIPKKLVLEDVTNDVLDTEQVMLQQVKIAKKEGMYKLIMERMDGILAETEMEYNGLYLDKEVLTTNKKHVQSQLSAVLDKLHDLTKPFNL